MTHLQATILGLIEGLTEFLPISSTFHLQLTSSLLGLPQSDFVKLFEIAIQSGAILAALWLNFSLLKSNLKLVKLTLLAFLPTGIIGFLLHSFIKQTLLESPLASALATIIIALVFLFLESKIASGALKLKLTLNELTPRLALLVGLSQSLAILPGVSRAGIVLVSLMFLGFQRTQAATFSFLLAIPTIFLATAYDLYSNLPLLNNLQSSFSLLLVGFVTAFITALVVIRWFISFLKNRTLTPFAYYRLFLGALLLIPLLFK